MKTPVVSKPSIPASTLPPVCRDSHSHTHLVVTVGRKWLTCVMLDFPIRLVQLPVDDHGLVPLEFLGKFYPLARAVKLFKRYGKGDHGITDGAAVALEELKAEVA